MAASTQTETDDEFDAETDPINTARFEGEIETADESVTAMLTAMDSEE